MTQTTGASINGSSLSIEISIKNKGTGAAFHVSPRIYVLNKTVPLPPLAKLAAGQTYSQTLSTNLGKGIKGEFHILSLVAYDDIKGRRHTNSAKLYLNTVPVNQHLLSLGLMTKQQTPRQSEHELIVKNLAKKPLAVSLRFVTPEAVAINQQSQTVELAPRMQKSIPLILNASNFRDIGSSPLFVIARYRHQGKELSQLISAPREEPSQAQSFFSSPSLVWGIAGGLVLLLVGTLLLNMKKKNQEAEQAEND